MTVDTAENNITQVRIDIGELKGILNTTVVSQGEKINDLGHKHETLRRDVDSVKDILVEKINAVGTVANTNTESIKNIREDVKQVQDKQNGTVGKVTLVLSPIIATFALIWAILGGK